MKKVKEPVVVVQANPAKAGAAICELLLKGASMADIIAAMKSSYPSSKAGQFDESCRKQVVWYRAQLKAGKLAIDYANGVPVVVNLKSAKFAADTRRGVNQFLEIVPSTEAPAVKVKGRKTKKAVEAVSA